MNDLQKLDLINGVISSWQSNNITVNGDANFFLDGLNAFYTGQGSNATQSTSVAQAISLINVSGGN